MKVRVKDAFIDRYTRELYKKGRILDLADSRVEEILSVGEFVESVDEKPKKKRTSRKTKAEQ